MANQPIHLSSVLRCCFFIKHYYERPIRSNIIISLHSFFPKWSPSPSETTFDALSWHSTSFNNIAVPGLVSPNLIKEWKTNCLKNFNEKKWGTWRPVQRRWGTKFYGVSILYIFKQNITWYLEDFWKVRLMINMPNLQINSDNSCKSDV